MMKKLVALFLVFAMVLGLAACGNKPAETTKAPEPQTQAPGGETKAPEPEKWTVDPGSNKSASGQTDKDVYIDMWGIYADGNYRAEYLIDLGKKFAEQFEKETGVSVEFAYFSQNDYGGCATKLAAGVSGGELPVLCQISSQQCPVFEPLCADVRDYMSKEAVDNYLPGLMVGCVANDGKVFAVPGGRSYGCYIVNMDLVKQAGYSEKDVETWDWAKFHEIMLAISKLGENIEGCGLWWDTDAWMYESALYANGGNIDNEDGTKITFQEDGNGAEFLDLCAEMMDDGSMYSVYGDHTASEVGDALNVKFVAGELGCRLASITTYGGIKKAMNEELKEEEKFEVYIANQPGGDGGMSVVTGGNNYLFLKQSTETQKKVAAKYLEFIAQDEYVAEWNGLSGYMAFTKSVYDSTYYAEVAKDPNMVRIGEGIKYAHRRPITLLWAEMRKYLMDGLTAWAQDYKTYKANNGGTTQAVVEMWAEHCQKIIDDNQ